MISIVFDRIGKGIEQLKRMSNQFVVSIKDVESVGLKEWWQFWKK